MDTPCCMPRQQVLDFKRAKTRCGCMGCSSQILLHADRVLLQKLTCEIDPMLEILTKPPVPMRERDISIPEPLADLLDNPNLHFRNAIAFKEALMGLGMGYA